MSEKKQPLLFIISGPAGSGKTTLCERLLGEFRALRRAVTATTRAPREGEENGRDYHFFTLEEFEAKKSRAEFLEWAFVHGRAYGTLTNEITRHFDRDEDVLLNIDVQGMRQVKEKSSSITWLADRVVTVFINPPSVDELRRRLKKRGTDDEVEIERRIETAEREMESTKEFDFILETQSREEDYDRIRSIYLAEKMRTR